MAYRWRVVWLMSAVVVVSTAVADERLVELQRSLNTVLPSHERVALTLGNDFEAKSGTVIFLARVEGAVRLVSLARAGRDEVAAVFLPRRNAWIVDGIVRSRDRVESDPRYGVAAMFTEPEVEFWHTHNILTDSASTDADETGRRMLTYAVPSDLDFREQYAWAELKAPAQFRGVIAGVLGTMTFWSDDYRLPATAPMAGMENLLQRLLADEAMVIQTKARRCGRAGLAAMASSNRSAFWYRFDPVP